MNSREKILRAFRNEMCDEVGIWFMRQAGRALPGYRMLREKYSFVEMCKTPKLIKDVTLLPLKYFDVDALIIFSDILTPLWGCDVELDFIEKKGPHIGEYENPVDVLKKYDISKNSFLFEGIGLVKDEIKDDKFLLGFSAAPYTFLAYFLDRGHSRNFLNLRKSIYEGESEIEKVFDLTTNLLIEYLEAQFKAGVDGVQIFDSWIGFINREHFIWYKKYLERIFNHFRDKNLIYFPLNSYHLYDLMEDLNFKVLSVDWRCDVNSPMDFGINCGIQGNLDPAVLLTDEKIIKKETQKILEKRKKIKGFIFNTGHGIYPETPHENIKYLVDFVHNWRG